MGIPGEKEGQETYLRNDGYNLSKSGERYRYPGISSPRVPSQDQPKENVTKSHYSQAVKNQRQRENFERSQRKKRISLYKGIPIKL